jgi:hypothetical protein
MNTPKSLYRPYGSIRQFNEIRALLQSHVPVEHEISLPLPTKRSHLAGYACFASPALRSRGQPLEQAAPDRWWVVDARSGLLVNYSLCSAIPFTSTPLNSLTLPSSTQTIQTLQQTLNDLSSLIELQAPAFFDGEDRPQDERMALLGLLKTAISPRLLPQYQELVPDFFAWLAKS